MQKILLAFITLVLISCKTNQMETEPRIALVSLGTIQQKSKLGQDLQLKTSQVNQEFEKARNSINERIQREANQIEKILPALSNEAKREKIKEFESKKLEAEKELSVIRDQLERFIQSERNAFIRSAKEAVAEIAKREKLNLVIDSDSVVYSEGIKDISEMVAEKLNQAKNNQAEIPNEARNNNEN